MVFAAWDVAVIQTAPDSDAVVVDCLTNVEAGVEIVTSFRSAAAELQDWRSVSCLPSLLSFGMLTKHITGQASSPQIRRLLPSQSHIICHS
jgi:hypothetical protein